MNVKQLDRAQSAEQIKKFLRSRKPFSRGTDFAPGNLLIYRYKAKFDEEPYDKRPMVLVLRQSTGYVLGLNFHWIPFTMRIWLVKYILRHNAKNIKAGRKIDFPYRKIKPLLKKMNYAPCIRLYIKSRISRKGVVLPPGRLVEAAQLRMEMFTGLPEEQLWQKKRR